MAYTLYTLSLHLHPAYRPQLPNLSLVLALLDAGFAAGAAYLWWYATHNGQYHWHQCRFYWWGRACRVQRAQDAALSLCFWSFTTTTVAAGWTTVALWRGSRRRVGYAEDLERSH